MATSPGAKVKIGSAPTRPISSIRHQKDLARATRIERVCDQRGIKLRGKIERVGPCPICGGNDRFSINIRKQIFNCRGCAVGGDVIALTQFLDGCNFPDAIKTLAGNETPSPPSPPPPSPSPSIYEHRQCGKARWLWRASELAPSTIVEKYLRLAA